MLFLLCWYHLNQVSLNIFFYFIVMFGFQTSFISHSFGPFSCPYVHTLILQGHYSVPGSCKSVINAFNSHLRLLHYCVPLYTFPSITSIFLVTLCKMESFHIWQHILHHRFEHKVRGEFSSDFRPSVRPHERVLKSHPPPL